MKLGEATEQAQFGNYGLSENFNEDVE